MASEFNELVTNLKSDWDNREIAFEALHNYYNILKYASPSIKDDKEFLMKVIAAREKPKFGRNTEGFLLEHASDRLKDDYDFVLACVSVDGDVLIYASERLRDNEKIAFTAIQNDAKALFAFSDRLKADKDFILSIIPYVNSHNFEARFLPEELRKDKDVAFAVLSVAGWNLQFFPYCIRNNKKIVMAAVSNAGWALGYASKRLRADINVALAAYKDSARAIHDMDESLFNNDAFVRFLLSGSGAAFFNDLPAFIHENEEYCRLACKNCSRIVSYIPTKFLDDEDFVRFLLRETECNALLYASDKIRDNEDIVVEACIKDPHNILHASERIQSNRKLTLYCVEKGARLSDIAKPFRDDREIVLLAVSHSGSNLPLASERLRGDILIALIALNGTFPHTVYWRADDWDGEYPQNLFSSVSNSLKKDPFFASLIIEAFMKTPYGEKQSMEDLKKDPCNIFNILDTICGEYVLCEGEKPPFGLDLNSAIELVKSNKKE